MALIQRERKRRALSGLGLRSTYVSYVWLGDDRLVAVSDFGSTGEARSLRLAYAYTCVHICISYYMRQ